MDKQLQRALAAEVRSELARRDVTAKAAAEAIGISETAWQTYFRKMNRDIPMRVLVDLAAYLRMPLWVLLRAAEEEQAHWDPSRAAAERALSQMSPEAAEAVRRVDEQARRALGGESGGGASERSTPA